MWAENSALGESYGSPSFLLILCSTPCLENPGVWGRAPSGDSIRQRGFILKKLLNGKVVYSEKSPVK